MRTLGFVSLLLCLGLSSAEAMIKIDMSPPTSRVVTVPENPRFVTEYDLVARAGKGLVEGALEAPKRDFRAQDAERAQLPTSRRQLDDRYAWDGVAARDGDELVVTGIVEGYKVRRVARVSKDWRRPTRAPVVERVLRDDGDLRVALAAYPEWGWYRVEWAYLPGDFDAGLVAGGVVAQDEDLSIDTQGEALVLLRLTPLWPDGSEGEPWTGWVRTDTAGPQGELTFGRGAPPAALRRRAAARAACDPAESARPVPVDPTFAAAADWHWLRGLRGSLAAFDRQRRLPVTPVKDEARVSVDAPEGTRFRLGYLPRRSRCAGAPLLVATTDRRSEPAPDFRQRYGDGVMSWVYEVPDAHAWPRMRIDAAPTLAELDAEPTHSQLALGMGQVDLPFDDEPLWVRVTPVWAEGVEGTPWTARHCCAGKGLSAVPLAQVRAEASGRAEPAVATETEAAGPVTCSAAGAVRHEGAPAAGTAAHHEAAAATCASRPPAALLGGTALLTWLLGLGLLRLRPLSPPLARALDAWSLPQMVAVGALLALTWASLVAAAVAGLALAVARAAAVSR